MKVYERTEDGTTSIVSAKDGTAEINHAMMDGKRDVREMSAAGTDATITYKDGRRVALILTEREAPRRREITAKGRQFIVSRVTPARPKREGVVSWIPEAYLDYWSARDGKPFGATRSAKASCKPGSVGRAVWEAAHN